MNFKQFILDHFAILALLFIFVFGAIMLAAFPGKDEMARWIEGGAVIGIFAQQMGSKLSNGNGNGGPKQ